MHSQHWQFDENCEYYIMRRKQVSGAALASTSQLEEPHLFIEEFDHETCRLCSLKSNGSFGIFSAKGVKKNLPALVKIYLNLEVCSVNLILFSANQKMKNGFYFWS